MITKQRKQEMVKDLFDRFARQNIVIFADFQGTSVMKAQELRRLLKKNDAEYKVARKTLIDRALEEHKIPLKTKDLGREVGIAFCYGEETGPAKLLVKFGRDNESFKILGGVLGTRILTDKDVIALAKLPPLEIMRGQVVGTLQGPIRGLVNVLQGTIRNLVVVLGNIQEQKQ